MTAATARQEPAASVTAVATDIGRIVEEVLGDLSDVADRVVAVYGDVDAGERFATRHLAALRPAIDALLDRRASLVSGAGFIAAPDVLDDAPYYLEWWHVGPQGRAIPLRLGTDPTAPDFYDYTRRPWFAEVERTRQPKLDGPYVDLLGANVYTLTATVPVAVGGVLLGVAGADLYLERLEGAVLPRLLAADLTATLVNEVGRVLVTSDPDRGSGSLLVPRTAVDADATTGDGRMAGDGAGPGRPPDLPPGLGAVRCGGLPLWLVAA